MSNISDRLKQLRGPTSQAEMARQLEIPRTQWIRYENGQNSPSAEMLAKICRIHAVSADWVLGLKDGDINHVSASRHSSVNLDELRTTATQLVEESAALSVTIKKLKRML